MKAFPTWLPPLISLNPWTPTTFEELYEIFKDDFKVNPPFYEGEQVWTFPEMEKGKEVIFWHLTHREDKETGERLPDFRRAERLPWIKAIIENAQRPEILAWDYKEGKCAVNTYLWLKNFDFLVLMKKYPNGKRPS